MTEFMIEYDIWKVYMICNIMNQLLDEGNESLDMNSAYCAYQCFETLLFHTILIKLKRAFCFVKFLRIESW